jgi:hypothetical protein
MTTTTFGGMHYERPATTTRLSGLLRSIFGAANRDRNLAHALSEAAYLGPEQLKEMGAYADQQTGLIYSTQLVR